MLVCPLYLDAKLFELFEHKFPASVVYMSNPTGLSAEGHPVASSPRVDDAASFQELGLDSLDTVELIVAVEKEFKVELTDEEHENIRNINQVIERIFNHPRAQ